MLKTTTVVDCLVQNLAVVNPDAKALRERASAENGKNHPGVVLDRCSSSVVPQKTKIFWRRMRNWFRMGVPKSEAVVALFKHGLALGDRLFNIEAHPRPRGADTRQ